MKPGRVYIGTSFLISIANFVSQLAIASWKITLLLLLTAIQGLLPDHKGAAFAG